MSLIKDFDIVTEKSFRAAFGIMRSSGEYKKTKITPEMLETIAKEAAAKGWSLPKEREEQSSEEVVKVSKDNTVTFSVLPEDGEVLFADDISIAKFYLYKHNQAKERNIVFSLSLSEFKSVIRRKVCYYTGIRFENIQSSRFKVSLDRKDQSIGYTKENTVACCFFVNQLKNELFERPDGMLRITPKQLSCLLSKLNN